MAKRRTKEQKLQTKLRKLQANQSISAPQPTFEIRKNEKVSSVSNFSGIPKFVSTSSYSVVDYSYVKKDLTKIVVIATLAIGIQVVLSFLISNTQSVNWLTRAIGR